MWSFQNRTHRLGYLGYSFVSALIIGVPAVILSGSFQQGDPSGLGALVMLAVLIPAAWIGLAATIRRLHDLGWSGWWIVLSVIPLVSLIQWIALLFFPGQSGANRFGASPA